MYNKYQRKLIYETLRLTPSSQDKQRDSQTARQPVSQTASQPDSQSAKQPVSQTASQPEGNSPKCDLGLQLYVKIIV